MGGHQSPPSSHGPSGVGDYADGNPRKPLAGGLSVSIGLLAWAPRCKPCGGGGADGDTIGAVAERIGSDRPPSTSHSRRTHGPIRSRQESATAGAAMTGLSAEINKKLMS